MAPLCSVESAEQASVGLERILEVPSPTRKRRAAATALPAPAASPAASALAEALPELFSKAQKKLSIWQAARREATPAEPCIGAADVKKFESAEELLAKVPADTLKRSLKKLGLKSSGKPEDRAARLFLLKDSALEDLPEEVRRAGPAEKEDASICAEQVQQKNMDGLLRECFLKSIATSWESVDLQASSTPNASHRAKVEAFIEEHALDNRRGYTAGMCLRECTREVQLSVMGAGSLEDARDRCATVLARIRNEGASFNTPVKGTRIYTMHMRPNRPSGTSLEVKHSSFKTLGCFFRSLEADGLISLKPGESDPLVTAIHWEHDAFHRAGFPQKTWPSL